MATLCFHLYMAKTGWGWKIAVPLKRGKRALVCHSSHHSLLIPNMEAEFYVITALCALRLSMWLCRIAIFIQILFLFLELACKLIDRGSVFSRIYQSLIFFNITLLNKTNTGRKRSGNGNILTLIYNPLVYFKKEVTWKKGTLPCVILSFL